jgi:hypothetical protein
LVDCFYKQCQLVTEQVFALIPFGVVYFEIGLFPLLGIVPVFQPAHFLAQMAQQPVGFFYAILEYRIIGRVVYVGFHYRAVLPYLFDVLDARGNRYFVQFDKQLLQVVRRDMYFWYIWKL